MSLPFLSSQLLTVPHGFSTREGGVSPAPWNSLNLSVAVGDTRENVSANFRRLALASGLVVPALHLVDQVHGATVYPANDAPKGLLENEADADALWTERPGAWLGVRTADCVPILIQDAEGRRVAAVHSGWRGTVARIVERAVEALARAGSSREGMLAAVGPCIQVCCYEVSRELAEQFKAEFGADVVQERDDGRPHLDLPHAIAHSLERAGIVPERQDVLGACTACEPALFYSHRRDEGRTGRHLSFIAPSAT